MLECHFPAARLGVSAHTASRLVQITGLIRPRRATMSTAALRLKTDVQARVKSTANTPAAPPELCYLPDQQANPPGRPG